MLKAYAVAVALSTTAPATTTNEVEAQPVDSKSQQTLSSTIVEERKAQALTANDELRAKKGYKRRRGLIIIP